MKTSFKFIYLAVLSTFLIFTACRDEEMEFVQTPADEALAANSNVATLIQRTASNDGSVDNIVDSANCFTLEFPFTVIVNGLEITVNTEEDLDTVEDIIDEFEDDDDTIVIEYPIVIILADFTEITVNSQDELEDLAEDCNAENEYDDDIECLDFEYPITISIFNSNEELIDTITITSDQELYEFVDDLDEDDIVVIDFPITVIFFDGTTQTINNLSELEAVIEEAEDDCDEDDDYDYDDDDCDDCTTDQLSTVLTGCSDWFVDDFEVNDTDLEDNYVGYTFNFTSDGSIEVDTGTEVLSGTWSASGSGNDIEVVIDIPDLPDFNTTWLLHEIEQYMGETTVELRIGDDELEFESDC